jgi:hypothetical protein
MSSEYMTMVSESFPGGGDEYNLALILADSAGEDGHMYMIRPSRYCT